MICGSVTESEMDLCGRIRAPFRQSSGPTLTLSPSTLTPQRVHAAAELLALMQSIRSALVRCWLAARVAGHDGARSKG